MSRQRVIFREMGKQKNRVNLYSIQKFEGEQGRRPIHWKGKEIGEGKYLILKCIEIKEGRTIRSIGAENWFSPYREIEA